MFYLHLNPTDYNSTLFEMRDGKKKISLRKLQGLIITRMKV